MKKLFYIVLCLAAVVFFVKLSLAGEHPGMPAKVEHPGEKPAEHPGGAVEHKEHPGKTHAEEHPGEKMTLSANQIIRGIKNHISLVTETNRGYFPLYDAQEGKDLRLNLVRVHEDRVSYIKKQNAYFACTDFVTKDGKTAYDIDFWMKADKEGNLLVYKTKIHKKDGKPRFTYRNDEIVTVE